MTTTENLESEIYQYAALTNNFFVIGQKPELPKDFKIKQELVCLEMVFETPINIDVVEEITPLYEKDAADIFDLVKTAIKRLNIRSAFNLIAYQ